MAAHAVVQRRPARQKALGLGVIGAMDQTHEFTRDIAMKPGWPERVLRHQPARRKDHEVEVGRAGRVARRGQYGEDRRVGMIEADRADRIERAQVVLVRDMVAMPRHDIQRRVADAGVPEMALELGDEFEVAVDVLEGRMRREEIARIGQPVAADRAEVREAHGMAEVLAHVPACGAIRQRHAEADPTRDQRDFLRLNLKHAHLGVDDQPAFLRDDQQLAIGAVKEAPVHRPVGRV